MKNEIPHQLKLKGLLWLRFLLKQKMTEEKGAGFSWNSIAIRSLSRKIASATGIQLSDRALRMTVSEQVTNKTIIPRKSHPKSRLDAISLFLGYENFHSFCYKEQQIIETLNLRCERKVFQSHVTQKSIEKICYDLEGQGEGKINTASVSDTPSMSTINQKHIVVYYFKNVGSVFRGLIQLNMATQSAKFTTYIKPEFSADGQNSTEITFKGKFKRHAVGFLELHVRLSGNDGEDDTFLMSAVLFVNKEALNCRFALGTYTTRSMYHFGCYAGKVLVEFCSNEITARKKYIAPTDERIEQYLKNTQIETEPMVFYTLEDLINYEPANYIVTL